MVPDWLHFLSVTALVAGFACAAVIALDEFRYPQHMWVMNVVWPAVALFGTIITLWGYFRYGKFATHEKAEQAKRRGEDPPSKKQTPFPVMVGKSAAHCGSGCCLNDILTEWLAFAKTVLPILGADRRNPERRDFRIRPLWVNLVQSAISVPRLLCVRNRPFQITRRSSACRQ